MHMEKKPPSQPSTRPPWRVLQYSNDPRIAAHATSALRRGGVRAAEKAAAAKAAAEKATGGKAVAEKAAVEKAAAEKVAAEKGAAEKAADAEGEGEGADAKRICLGWAMAKEALGMSVTEGMQAAHNVLAKRLAKKQAAKRLAPISA